MGNLRGIVHAGAKGDTDASVVAFRLWATQLRIGNVIGRAPDGGHGQPGVPEIARVRDGEVVIDPFPGLGSLEEFLLQK
jgi:septum site-determining protein MinC